MSAAPSSTVHDGGGTQLLTSNMIQSGQTYQNYLIRTQLNVSNVQNVSITNCDVGGWTANNNGIFLNDVTNVSVTNNNFHDLPGSNGIGAYPTTLIGVNLNNNNFNNVFEPIHLDFGNSGASKTIQIENNSINGYGRVGIELQDAVSGLEVLDNYITGRTNPGSNTGLMAISCATGCPMSQGASSNNGVDTHNVEIAGNVLIGPAWYGGYDFAIEDYGSGSNVHDNYIEHWHVGVGYCWTGVSGQVPWSFSNNTLVDVPGGLTANEGYGQQKKFSEVNPSTNGNSVFAAGAGPAIPSVAATIGGTTTTTSSTPAPAPTATPATFSALSGTDGIDLTLPGTAGTLTWTATGNTGGPLTNPTSGETNSIAIPAGTTSYVDTSVPDNWAVYYTFSGAPNQSSVVTNSAQVISPVSANAPVSTPVSTPVEAPIAPIAVTIVVPTAPLPQTQYIPLGWSSTPSQAIPNFDGPLP